MTGVLSYITWNVSPFIYEGEHFAIGWYGTLWTLGLIGMLITLLVTFKHDGVPSQFALITFMVSLVCVIFFGHLFQGLFYEWYYSPDDPGYYLGIDWDYRNWYFDHPWKFLDFAHGGFASHGMILGVLLTGCIMEEIIRCSKWWVIDRAVMGFFILAICVRLGNFFNAEIYGIPTTLSLGVLFPDDQQPSHPTQFYELISYAIPLVFVWWLYAKREGGAYKGLITSIIVFFAVVSRFLIEFLKNPQMQIESGWTLNMGQWLSIPYIVFSLWLLIRALRDGKQTDIGPSQGLTPPKKRKR